MFIVKHGELNGATVCICVGVDILIQMIGNMDDAIYPYTQIDVGFI